MDITKKSLTRRGFLKSAGVTVGTLAAAACGVKATSAPAATEVSASAATVPQFTLGSAGAVWTVPELYGKHLEIGGLNYDKHYQQYEILANNFQSYTGLKRQNVNRWEWPIEDNLITAMAAGEDVPDVVCIMGKQIGILVDQGLIVPLDGMYKSMGVDLGTWFGPVARDSYTRGGEIYGVPLEGNATSGVVNVRLDDVVALGLEDMWPPFNGKDGFDSFEDMWALAKAMMIVDSKGNVERWGLSGEGWYANQLLGIILSLGGQYYDAASDQPTLDTPEGEEAMYRLAYKPIFELKIDTQHGMGGQEVMNANKAAMAAGNVTGTPSGLSLDPPINIDTCLYPPAIPGTKPTYVGEGGWGFVGTTQGQNKDVGLEFLKYLTTDVGNADYCRIYGDGVHGGIVSAVITVNSDPDLFPAGTLLGDSMARAGKGQALTKFYDVGDHNPSDLVKTLSTVTEAVRIGELTPKQAMVQAQAQLEELFEIS